MKTAAYTCRLGDNCADIATVQIRDAQGSETRGCFQHAYEALKAIDGAKVVWSKSHPPNEYAERALRLAENPLAI